MPLAPPVTTTTALAKVETVVVGGGGGGGDDDGESVVSWMFLNARREMSNPNPIPSPRPTDSMAPVHDPGIVVFLRVKINHKSKRITYDGIDTIQISLFSNLFDSTKFLFESHAGGISMQSLSSRSSPVKDSAVVWKTFQRAGITRSSSRAREEGCVCVMFLL